MIQSQIFRFYGRACVRQLDVLQHSSRAYSSSNPIHDSEAADLDAARQWFEHFDKNTIPTKIGETSFSRSSGPGGQKVNKTDSKATTAWPFYALSRHIPRVLHQGLRESRYYVLSSDSIKIQCDTHRSQSKNEEETHNRLIDEIDKIYKDRVPGVISPEQMKRLDRLQKAENESRLRIKKKQSDKKRARSGGDL